MPVHIDEINSELDVVQGDMPLSEQQIDMLVRLILERLEQQQRQARRNEQAVALRHRSAPPLPFAE